MVACLAVTSLWAVTLAGLGLILGLNWRGSASGLARFLAAAYKAAPLLRARGATNPILLRVAGWSTTLVAGVFLIVLLTRPSWCG